MKKAEVLWWSVIVAAVALVIVTVILPRLARARESSWTIADGRLARCTNLSLKILIKQMPERRKIDLVLGVPRELTNAMEQVSGSISASAGLTVAGATSMAFAVTATNHATRPTIVMSSNEELIAYFLGSIEGAPSRSRPGKIDLTFSNVPPPGASLWARYQYDRYRPVHVK